MTFGGVNFLEILVILGILVAVIPFLGLSIARFFQMSGASLKHPLTGVERILYKISGINPLEEMTWKHYARSLICFNVVGISFLIGLLVLQKVPFALALNIAVSFVTNTNWQAYSGEVDLKPWVQMLGLGVQNFLSAATGIAVMVVLARSIRRKLMSTVGNFWTDLVRSTIYVLLPLSLIGAVPLMSEGVVQTFESSHEATTLEGKQQILPVGPVASQISIKQLGSNGGGFFGTNSAHPYENPSPFSNLFELLALLLLPGACIFTFGILVGDRRHAWALFGSVFGLFLVGLAAALYAQTRDNPFLFGLSFLEGTELRHGISSSAFWATATSASSNGSTNLAMSSMSPIAGLVALFNILSGEVIFGGVGSGVYGLILFAIITVFLAGLMVGRTPEYLGKKISSEIVILSSIGLLAPGLLILIFSAVACLSTAGLSSLGHSGPHGLSEILYAFASMVGNNGSAFGSLNAASPFYLWAGSFCMFVGRFGVILPVIALAGKFAEAKITPPSSGTFPTNGPLFGFLLVVVIILFGALTFFPALSLGPIAEHFLMLNGKGF